MTNEEIKLEKEQIFVEIKSLEERLKELRTICKHEKTFVYNYSWRIGKSITVTAPNSSIPKSFAFNILTLPPIPEI